MHRRQDWHGSHVERAAKFFHAEAVVLFRSRREVRVTPANYNFATLTVLSFDSANN
jgi:hypothetical protein